MQIKKAIKYQEELRNRVRIEHIEKKIRIIAGGDVAYNGNIAVAGIVAVSIPELKVVEKTFSVSEIVFPYISGFLAFREAPVLLKAIKKLKYSVDVFIFDGQGIAHPRRIGLASHIGVLIKKPSIGCAKSVLTGNFSLPGIEKSSYTFLYDEDNIIGAVVRTKTGTRPVVVSVGHKITLIEAIEIVLQCCSEYRIPEPVRLAHIFANEIIRDIAYTKSNALTEKEKV
ncbi:MAG: Endonuclease V [candidate division TA06 bacterium ADurb.Bin131]|uniref:Endonuclease V n=1 Tax=candidate division TA06 bacterium ADurb.Bin131 TaxID=1852827 RepID=A0A1V6CDQ3_UNCT6|nr:MAG: Endonuclease V [candidate division TA06 bacterium ADurb.Bin131]